MEFDAPVARYYERLAAVQARGSQASHQVLRDILREVRPSLYSYWIKFSYVTASVFDMYLDHIFLYCLALYSYRNTIGVDKFMAKLSKRI